MLSYYFSANMTTALLLQGFIMMENGWIAPFNGYQYKASPGFHTWSAGQAFCRSWGGDLAQYGVRDVATRT